MQSQSHEFSDFLTRRLEEQRDMVRMQLTLNEVAIFFALYQVHSYYSKKLVLATFKSSCIISRVEDVACSARVLQAVFKKTGNLKMKGRTQRQF